MSAPTTTATATGVLSDRATLRLCTAGSVDDGKSTFVYRYFATDKRTFILADTPGHEQYTRNTVTGMSTSQVVVLLVDARNGIKPQTVRHLTVASLLGVKTVILAVNKIDLVDYSEEVFEGIRTEFEQRAAALGITEPHAVPISALKGDNVVERSEATPWYEGPSVLELLETIPVHSGRALDLPFRFNIQYVLREHATDYRAYAGTVNAGTISVGDTVTAPNGKTTTVTHIDTADGLDGATTANAGDSIALRLADDIDLARGDPLCGAAQQGENGYPEFVREFHGTVVGLTDKDVTAGKAVKLRYGSSLVRARVASVDRVLDIDGSPENNNDETAPESFGLNDIAHVTVQTAQELPVEDYAARGAVGNFLLIDQASGNTLAAGLVGTRLR